MRNDANDIALRAVKNMLDAARPFNVVIDGKEVVCTTKRHSRSNAMFLRRVVLFLSLSACSRSTSPEASRAHDAGTPRRTADPPLPD
ncbi:MAG TPA: hypothetical protein VE987_05690, partial [Polyangiaceae bacterium]|nr:hypothetical protein [Polyangiaceae bacterium]